MPTINDIAKACGVSTATVSYVLNNNPKHALLPETRERVLRTMREMGYRPNAVARGLTRKRINMLGILFIFGDVKSVVTNPYYSGILQGMLAGATVGSYNVTIYTEPWRTAELSMSQFQDGRTDGTLIVSPPLDWDIIPELATLGSPLAVISYDALSLGIPSVDVDNARGVEMALEHLVGLGHKRIAYVTGPKNMYSGVVRRKAFYDKMAAVGLEVRPEYVGGYAYHGVDSNIRLPDLMKLPEPPTAIMCSNDFMALGMMREARTMGLRVPEDFSLIGFDDVPACAMTTPGLTTIHQPLNDIGEVATRELIKQLNGEKPTLEIQLLEPTLVVRESTCPPKS